MTGEQDTGNPAWLPLVERIRRGFSLASQDRLRVDDIAQLEHPGETFSSPKVEAWIRRMETALEYGALQLPPGETYDRFGGWPCISQDAYRTWRATQPDTPAGSLIHLWLSPLPPGEPAPLPQGEPDRPEQGAAAKRAALAQLLDELDKRAVERGAGFDRHSLPGTKAEFALLLKSHCPIFRHIGTARIASYLKGHCQFQRGAQSDHGKGAAVWALFPEYDLK